MAFRKVAKGGRVDEFVRDFLVETSEMLAVLDCDLLQLEAAPGDTSRIASIFRAMHTIKGTCGFLGLTELGRLAHAGENVLGRLREATLRPSPEVVSGVLRCVDAIKAIVATIAATGAEGSTDHTALLADLDALFALHAPSGAAAPDHAPCTNEIALIPPAPPAPGQSDAVFPPTPTSLSGSPAVSAPAGVALPRPEQPEPPRDPAIASQTIRVGIDLLEGLMTTVSELVLTRNQLLQLLRNEKDSRFTAPLQHLSLLTSELQESVMKTRMQPIGNAWSTLPRIVRDLARELGKQIELVTDGADTELDRQVLELIKDPLTHMIRNASDHGLEPPAERLAAGKPPTGRIRLSACQEGGHIIIRISDDGRGMDLDRIRNKAVQNGLATAAEAAAMSDAQVFRFILRPGFSTAAAVTSVSGRGVGMDVVRANIEKIGGTIDVAATPGKGADFTIKIPLTLAIVAALIIGVADQRYAIPQLAVVELVRAAPSGERRIETINRTAVLRLRDRLLPLVDLRATLGIDAPQTAAPAAGPTPAEDQLIIVTQSGAGSFGIVVDCIHDTEEIVVKPVAPLLKSLGVYSGNTILGDGSVCMIIDPNGLAARIGGLDIAAQADAALQPAAPAGVGEADPVRLLLVRAGSGPIKAIPLDLVTRIEEIDAQEIRQTRGRMLIQYRNHLMPLVRADDDVVVHTTGPQPIVVLAAEPTPSPDGAHLDQRRRAVGLVVDEIIDIVETAVAIDAEYARPGIAGAGIIGAGIIGSGPVEVVNAAFHLQRGSDDGIVPPASGPLKAPAVRHHREAVP
jgi:two-component system chemotaxis sensor kinase CheA